MTPSSRGLGHRPFTAVTGVRIPVGSPIKTTEGWFFLWRNSNGGKNPIGVQSRSVSEVDARGGPKGRALSSQSSVGSWVKTTEGWFFLWRISNGGKNTIGVRSRSVSEVDAERRSEGTSVKLAIYIF